MLPSVLGSLVNLTPSQSDAFGMSQVRPKRKATKRSYNESVDESIFEERPKAVAGPKSSSKKRSTKRDSTVASGTGAAGSGVAPAATEASKTPQDNVPSGVPHNWQPVPELVDYFSHRLNLRAAFVDVSTQTLYCPNQPLISLAYEDVTPPVTTTKKRKLAGATTRDIFKIQKHDFIYMISEPPGEPYYIGSVIGFVPKVGSPKGAKDDLHLALDAAARDSHEDAAHFVFKIQWFYRPRDISKSTSDSRLLFASMHTDTCPLLSFRGFATVRHKQDIESGLVPLAPALSRPPSARLANATGTSTPSKSSSSSPPPPPPALSPLELYSLQPNCFYFDKLFDRYMIKFYDIILTRALLEEAGDNDDNRYFLRALNKRFEYVFVENAIAKAFVKSFASLSCNCEKCGQWCSNQDLVTCIVCDHHFHMYCLDPPLLRKPSRGFSWSCARCSKLHDLEHQRKKMIMLSHDNKLSNESELTHELSTISSPQSVSNDDNSIEFDNISSKDDSPESGMPKFEMMAKEFLERDAHNTIEQRRIQEEWNMRYLGMYARLEDGVDVEDRSPYPRAQTRLGSKHQALNLPECNGHPLVYYDDDKSFNAEANGGGKKKNPKKSSQPKLKKSCLTASEEKQDSAMLRLYVPHEYQGIAPSEYPQWLQPRPKGYLARGVDDGEGRTITLLFKPSAKDIEDGFEVLDLYVEKCNPFAERLGLIPTTPNFMDAILKTYMENNGNIDKSLSIVETFTRDSLSEPTFSAEEVQRFENGVRKYGSELHPTAKEVKTQPIAMVVRFYYLWKKTPSGRSIWGNYEGRIQKKIQNVKDDDKHNIRPESNESTRAHKVPHGIDSLACVDDDSSYETSLVEAAKKLMTCKHCFTNQSMIWYRVTGFDADTDALKSSSIEGKVPKGSTVALCFRCAKLWRRYAVVWDDPLEVKKKNTRGAGGWKKKVEYELVRDSEKILQEAEVLGGIKYLLDVPESSIAPIPPTLPAKPKTVVKRPRANPITVPIATASPPRKKPTTLSKDTVTAESNEASGKHIPPVKLPEPLASGSTRDVPSKRVKSTVKTRRGNDTNASAKNAPADGLLSTGVQKGKRKAEAATRAPKKPTSRKIATATAEKKSETTLVKNEASLTMSHSKRKHQPESLELNGAEQKPSVTTGRVSRSRPSPKPKTITTLNLNPSYKTPIFESEKALGTSPLTKDSVRKIVEQFHQKQLLDVGARLSSFQGPVGAVTDTPFAVTDRDCSVCCVHDEITRSSLEMLICSNCGVNVHASCVAVNIPHLVHKPVKEWLCEPCVNDLNPQHSTIYSCSLCLANETNYELAVLGSDIVRPDFLKPIGDSGKWCHLICAIFNHQHVSFRPPPKKLNRNEGAFLLGEALANSCFIESVSEIYMQNYTSTCGVCHAGNGSLVQCEECIADAASYYHPTCAQDTIGFKLGFKLLSLSEVDSSKLVVVHDSIGALAPVVVCPQHNANIKSFVSFRDRGKRSNGNGEEKPVIQLFLEDLVKGIDVHRLSGPQAKAHNYIRWLQMFDAGEKKRKQSAIERLMKVPGHDTTRCIGATSHQDTGPTCIHCHCTSSPKWWPVHCVTGDTNGHVGTEDRMHCQSCHHETEDGEEKPLAQVPYSQSLVDILNEPLNEVKGGLKGPSDKLILTDLDFDGTHTTSKMRT